MKSFYCREKKIVQNLGQTEKINVQDFSMILNVVMKKIHYLWKKLNNVIGNLFKKFIS